ncbi:hypothetical protein A3715_04025 [Oleiphilus sp. HI0009]|uniref:class I SAM-dependent methyltransferase n=1 Tax=unclassified Oleiphilus TaxID=2631174 RepID=UPI0007C22EDC|nr:MULTISPECIES: class I SAM-dependent methyltransferase [unclassified Oleiphilus]KZX84987.1 hypothetical protein A3715_04025 [Oleiphilus sp. HI0009]KZY63325.1 hypothetical protein A3738_12050 [Oleiphilus sp. HI0066]KZY72184.1 hypothetical protein A3739_15810 [Oleiphilus sp. HI0067]
MDMHKEFPKTVDRTDFWRQIKRTVNGEPVSEGDINSIVEAIDAHLFSESGDDEVHLLDLGCGNAALASYIFDRLDSYTGVDFSEYLVGVAKEFFSHDVVREYVVADISKFVANIKTAETFTHVLCYGVMSYLSKEAVDELFGKLWEVPSISKVFIGNLPNKPKAKEFFSKRNISSYDLDDNMSAIGVWWHAEELIDLAKSKGWKASVSTMPEGFYAAKYRFDLTLQRA